MSRDPEVVLKHTLLHSLQFSSGETSYCVKEVPILQIALVVFENLIEGDKLKKFEEVGCDVMLDEFYSVWIKMKLVLIIKMINNQTLRQQVTQTSLLWHWSDKSLSF